MGINMDKMLKYGLLGFVAALVTGFLLNIISQIVSIIPGVNVDLQAISITTTGVSGVVNTGLSQYVMMLLGKIPYVSGMDWIAVGIGGALFVGIGALLVDNLKFLQFAKTKAGKLATIFVVAGVIVGWIMSMAVTIPAISAMIIMAVDAIILAYILVAVDDMIGLKIIP